MDTEFVESVDIILNELNEKQTNEPTKELHTHISKNELLLKCFGRIDANHLKAYTFCISKDYIREINNCVGLGNEGIILLGEPGSYKKYLLSKKNKSRFVDTPLGRITIILIGGLLLWCLQKYIL